MKAKMILPLVVISLATSACTFNPWWHKKTPTPVSSSEEIDPHVITEEDWNDMMEGLDVIGVEQSFGCSIHIIITINGKSAESTALFMGDHGKYELRAEDGDRTFYDVDVSSGVAYRYDIVTVDQDSDDNWVGELERMSLFERFMLFGFYFGKFDFKDLKYNESNHNYEADKITAYILEGEAEFLNISFKFNEGVLQYFSLDLGDLLHYDGTFIDHGHTEVTIPEYTLKDE